MLKVVEPLRNRVSYTPEGGGDPVNICTEGYRLENGLEVQYIGDKWVDYNEHEYTAIDNNGSITGFVQCG